MRVGHSSSALPTTWHGRNNLSHLLIDMKASVKLPLCSEDQLYLLLYVSDTATHALDLYLKQKVSVEPR